MNILAFIKVATIVAYLCPYFATTQVWSNELPQTTQYGIIYDYQTAISQMRFVAPYDMEIIDAEPNCGCTEVQYPQGLLNAGESYAISYQIDPWGRAGVFTPSIDFRLADKPEKWQLHLKGQVVPVLPNKLNLGQIRGDDLSSIIRRIPLVQIEGQPLHIHAVQVEGNIEATVVDEGKALKLSPGTELTWGERISATVEATIEADGKEYNRSINVQGQVSPRFSLMPQTASFGVGAAHRREVSHVRIRLPMDLAEAPITVSPSCDEVKLEVEYQREAGNDLSVQIHNTSDFPSGILDCGVKVQVGTEQVIIPVLALTR